MTSSLRAGSCLAEHEATKILSFGCQAVVIGASQMDRSSSTFMFRMRKHCVERPCETDFHWSNIGHSRCFNISVTARFIRTGPMSPHSIASRAAISCWSLCARFGNGSRIIPISEPQRKIRSLLLWARKHLVLEKKENIEPCRNNFNFDPPRVPASRMSPRFYCPVKKCSSNQYFLEFYYVSVNDRMS